MPAVPLIDTHVHLWDPSRLQYAWQRGNLLLDRAYLIEDLNRAYAGIDVAAYVFVECFADFTPTGGQYLGEIEFVEENAAREPRLKAIVPMAPLERGQAVAHLLEEMVLRSSKIRGIRRIVEFDADPRALLLSPNFLAGVRELERFDLHFEINVNFRQMDWVLEFVPQVPAVRLILDHCGKPGIKGGQLDLFRRHMNALSRFPNVLCKLSDLAVEADWTRWTEADLRPYIETTLETFGVDRVLYGGDWPVCLQASSLKRWVEVLDEATRHLSSSELHAIYFENANRFYRLGLS